MQAPALVLALVLSLACAGSTGPADRPIDWTSAAEPWSIFIVTEDADGGERATRIWLVEEGGVGAIRTGDTRWRANLDRDPGCRLRLNGVDYPLRAVAVNDPDERRRIDQAFLAKYGWQERWLIANDRADSDDPFYRLLPAPE